jgi:hypothetical protein
MYIEWKMRHKWLHMGCSWRLLGQIKNVEDGYTRCVLLRRKLMKQSSSSKRQQCRWNGFQCVLKVDSRQDVTWWLDRVEIARKEFWGTKWRWRASDDLETEAPWLGWRREYLRWVEVPIKLWKNHVLWRITSLLNHMESDLWMKSVVLIIWSERSKATVQGHDARGNEVLDTLKWWRLK